jgi:hypothetical protein
MSQTESQLWRGSENKWTGGWISTRVYKEVAKAKLASNKTRVFLTAAKGYKEVGERPQGCWGHIPTLGLIRLGLYLIHGPLGQIRVTQHRG